MARKKRKEAGDEMPGDVSALTGWSPARQVVDPTRAKVQARRITINLDEDVIAVFKTEAFLGGPPYQVAINQALRSYLRGREQLTGESAAATVLEALENREVIRRIRQIR